MECVAGDFLNFFDKKLQILAFGWTACYSTLNPTISGTFLKLLSFLQCEILTCLATRRGTRAFTF